MVRSPVARRARTDSRHAQSKSRSGFTFLEILISIVIIGILAGVVGFSMIGHLKKTRIEATRLQMRTFKGALQMYLANHGQYPTQQQSLLALCVLPDAGPIPENYPEEGYLDSRLVPLDGWGHDFVYLIPGRDDAPYEVVSYGSDGEPGGDDYETDISTLDL